jgi:Ca2+/Na+ antiporter
VILIAFLFVWGMRFIGVSIDGQVYKWGQVVVGLICVIILVSWLLGALGVVRPDDALSSQIARHAIQETAVRRN